MSETYDSTSVLRFYFTGTKNLIPCTVINWTEEISEVQELDSILDDFARHDDVWSRSFSESKTASL